MHFFKTDDEGRRIRERVLTASPTRAKFYAANPLKALVWEREGRPRMTPATVWPIRDPLSHLLDFAHSRPNIKPLYIVRIKRFK